MNRRDFLKLAAAAVVASRMPALPVPVEPPGKWVSIDVLRNAAARLAENAAPMLDGRYIVVVHPDYEPIIRELCARDAWKAAYREARMEIKGMAKRAMASGEIGRIGGVRYITAESIYKSA